MNVGVALINPLYEGNVGAVARLMANYSLSNLYLIDSCDIGDEAYRRARQGQGILDTAIHTDVLPEYNTIITTTGVVGGKTNILRTPIALSEITPDFVSTAGDILLVFGREDHGLSNKELRLGDFVLHIEASSSYPVLNLSHAVGITLHHLHTLEPNVIDGASRDQKDAFLTLLQRIQNRLEITNTCKDNQQLVFRKLLSQGLSKKECNILFGFLRNIQNEL